MSASRSIGVVEKDKLFDSSRVMSNMKWNRISKIGPGLKNLSHTCYMNVVLQCLTYTPVFAQLCMEKAHSLKCTAISTSCLFCLVEKHCNTAMKIASSGRSDEDISTLEFVSRLRFISKTFKSDTPQDPHEFLREFLDKLQVSSDIFASVRIDMMSVNVSSLIAYFTRSHP
jgi:ubiquitin C-terminal hydrolase